MSKFLSIPSLFIIVVLCTFVSCSSTKSNNYINKLTERSGENTTNRLEQITNLWVGHFSNKNSIGNGSSIDAEQEVIGRKIWEKERMGEYWIYTGWFQADSYESALSSSIAQITKVSPDTAFITFYRIKEGLNIDKYEWRKDNPFSQLKLSDLESCGDGCGSFLVKGDNGTYQVLANKPCYDPISAKLKYYTVDATLSYTELIFNTKYLDDQLNTLMHYKNNTFSRLNKAELQKKYENFAFAN